MNKLLRKILFKGQPRYLIYRPSIKDGSLSYVEALEPGDVVIFIERQWRSWWSFWITKKIKGRWAVRAANRQLGKLNRGVK